MQKNSDYFSRNDAQKLFQSPAARELLALLQSRGRLRAEQAAAQAARGDYRAAQALLGELMQDPQARALLSRLEGK